MTNKPQHGDPNKFIWQEGDIQWLTTPNKTPAPMPEKTPTPEKRPANPPPKPLPPKDKP